MTATAYAVDLAMIQEARERIAGLVHVTPVMTCRTLDELAGRRIFLKCENLQKVGAFKARGATNAVARLSDEQAARGVVTHSSGNHAQALALAARQRGIPAHIVMPVNSPAVKRRAVEGYGARVIACEPTLAAREETAAAVQRQTGATFIHPYDHPDIIAGQGTVALELLQQVPDVDAILAPVGGGGLMSGICVAVRATRPGVRVLAAEPAGADDAWQSFQVGRLIPQESPRTIADGLRTSLGELTWPILRDHLDNVIRVGEREIVDAMRLVWERTKLIIEPSSAVPVAAVLSDQFRQRTDLHRVAIVLSGGNVSLDQLPW
ncbi:MAG: pyridoxal-phosphate dependent enzyme [Pirellulaceae bacterium]|nr:pyridoxal-phosphate dependent enzyme [Pirellulaceae bacterium]